MKTTKSSENKLKFIYENNKNIKIKGIKITTK